MIEDGAADRDVGFLPSAAAGTGGAAVPLAEERVRAGGAVGGQGAQAAGVVLPWPFFPRPLRGPDWSGTGASPAQDTSASGVGNRVMSRPISAISPAAVCRLTPGISSSRAAAGSTAASSPSPASGPVVPSASMPQAAGIAARWSVTCCSRRRSRRRGSRWRAARRGGEGVLVPEPHPGERLDQLGLLVRILV